MGKTRILFVDDEQSMQDAITGITIPETGVYGEGVVFDIIVPDGEYCFGNQTVIDTGGRS
jgi:hypothetical protein